MSGWSLTGNRILWVILATVVLIAGIFLMWPHSQPGAYPKYIDSWLLNLRQRNADFIMENIEYINNQAGRDEWLLQAQWAWYLESNEKVRLEDVQTKFFLKSGKIVTLWGQQAIYDTKSKNINLWGEVKALTSDGERFYTDAITYNNKDGLLSTPEEVLIMGSSIDLRGRGLTYELATGNMAIWKDVQVVAEKSLR